MFMPQGVWMLLNRYLQMRPLRQAFVPVVPSATSASPHLSLPKSCHSSGPASWFSWLTPAPLYPGKSPPVGLDSEVLVSMCCSLEEGCVSSCWWLECPSLTDTCTLTCTSSPVSTEQCILHSLPSKSPIPSFPTRCLGSHWLKDPASDPQFLASQSHSD